jgi:hypothetical protein
LVEGSTSSTLDRLESVVIGDASTLLEALAYFDFTAAQWCARGKGLDRDWDQGGKRQEDLSWDTFLLFQELDNASLVAWWWQRQENQDNKLGRLVKEVEEAENWLVERVDLFLGLATDAADVLSNLRHDLDSKDPLLWRTALKHRRIEEARDDVELAPTRQELIRSINPNSRSQLEQVSPAILATDIQYAQAASAAPLDDPFFKRLAAESPENVAVLDYQQAWARFIAATSLGTSTRESWLDQFLKLALNEPLEGEWALRLRAAERIAKERDWQRRYLHTGILDLEPRSFPDLSALATWLHELVSPPPENSTT